MKLFKGLALTGLAHATEEVHCQQLETISAEKIAKWWESDHYKYRYDPAMINLDQRKLSI